MSCPTHRKGAMKAAMVQRAEVDGELGEPPRAPLERVVATGFKDLAIKLGEKAMRVLEEDLEVPDPRARQEAARALVAAATKFAEGDEPPPPLTPEERRVKLLGSLRDAMAGKDPELRAALEDVGLVATRAEASKETGR